MASTVNAPSWTYCPDPPTKPKDKPLQVNSVAVSDDGELCVFGTYFERGSGSFKTYIMHGDGTEKWSTSFGPEASTQGVYWVDISGNGKYVACGGQTGTNAGLLEAYNSSDGNVLLSESLDSRVNQVSLSKDGQYLAACYNCTIAVYQLSTDKKSYKNIYSHQQAFELNSCMISSDGSTVVASGIHYAPDSNGSVGVSEKPASGTSGVILSFSVSGKEVTSEGSCSLPTGSMRVAITENGGFWGASLHSGGCALMCKENPTEPVWIYAPSHPGLSLAYAIDITLTSLGDVFISCGANLDNQTNGGLVYLVKSKRLVYEGELKYPPAKYVADLQWSNEVQFGVNPGVSLDQEAKYVSATDGKPDGQTVHESAGHFYLFDAANGSMLWQYDTPLMNWPMTINRSGSCALGGGDGGSIYYWNLSDS